MGVRGDNAEGSRSRNPEKAFNFAFDIFLKETSLMDCFSVSCLIFCVPSKGRACKPMLWTYDTCLGTAASGLRGKGIDPN